MSAMLTSTFTISRFSNREVAAVLLLSCLFLSVGLSPAWGQDDELTTEVGVLNVAPEDSEAGGLSAEVAFRDSTGDRALDPAESGVLEISVANQADGPASNVGVWIHPTEGEGQIRLPASEEAKGAVPENLPDGAVRVAQIEELPAGVTREITTRLRGEESLSGEPVSLAVELSDEHGFAPDRSWSLAVQTQEGAIDANPDRPPVVDRKVPETSMSRPNAIAVVVGVKEYQHSGVPNVEYALRDAQTMKKYLTNTLGFREENVIFEPNATGSVLQRLFGSAESPEGQLYNWVKRGESDVYVFYSGHGAPDPSTGKAFLLGSDINPNYMSINGYPAQQLYENLAQVPARSVTVVLDACFSGVTDEGPVVQRASPVELSVENPVMAMENGLAFTAGAADQIASWHPEKKHGLFTYFFLKGLRGEAEQDGDQAITAEELEAYLTDRVPYQARRMYSREQVPQVVGQNKDRTLVQYEEALPSSRN